MEAEVEPVRVGVIGCGVISGTYLRMAQQLQILQVVACADMVIERAEARAAEFGVARACTVDELLADTEVELVLNLTIPAAHATVSLAALAAEKHVYSEKPLAINRTDGQRIRDVAQARGLVVGCAPDTFLGGGLQTCRKLLDDGWIGVPVAATAFMLNHGPERWHPDPAFFYQHGAGPLFDVGPYYLTALVNFLGPVRRVAGSAKVTFAERTITSEPRYGERIAVETPTHITGVLDFAGGAVGTLITSFDVWASRLPFIEIYGTQGSLSVPDPNKFGGKVRVRRAGAEGWSEEPLTHGYTSDSRGIGLAEMAYALRAGRSPRADGALAYHVLDVMQAIIESSVEGRHIALKSACERPAPLPLGLLAEETLAAG